MLKSISTIILIFLSACAQVPLSEGEKAVRIYKRSDPPSTCKEVGKIKVSRFATIQTDEAIEDGLRIEAYKLGGNALLMEGKDDYMNKGTAFKCDK